MDGFRKIPENVPNKDLLEKFIEHPLTVFLILLKNLIVLVIIIT